MTDRPKDVVVGEGACPRCGAKINVKATIRGHLSYVCPPPGDGGCGHQHFDRYNSSDEWTAKNVVKKWRKPEYRKIFLGLKDDPEPEPAPEPAPELEPAPAPKPEPEPAPELTADERARKELFG